MSDEFDPLLAGYLERLEDCYRTLRGEAASTYRGRRRSGFTTAGYHESSFLYGQASALAGLLELPIYVVPTYGELRSAAEEDARSRFLADVTERGAAVFEHPGGERR